MSVVSLPLLSTGLFLAAHWMVWRCSKAGSRGIMAMTGLAVFAFLVTGVLAQTVWDFSWSEFGLYLAVAQLFVLMLYMHWYVGLDRSVSIRILGEMSARTGRLRRADLKMIYPIESMFSHRLALMTKTGWLECDNDRFVCSAKATRLAKLALRLRQIYNLRVSG